MNTLETGRVRCIVFKEEDIWYGIGLEFNIVIEGDDKQVVQFKLQETIREYVDSLAKTEKNGFRAGASTAALNQTTDPEYEEMWNKLQSNEPILSPIQQVGYFGVEIV